MLSGYNITLVAEAVRRLVSSAPRFIAHLVPVITIILFVLLAGSQTAAVRAGMMASITIAARATGRERDGVTVLIFVAALMTLYNPGQLLHDISFHLSFLATLGLLIFSPIFDRLLYMIPERLQLRSIVSTTLATQLFLLPYLAYAIGEVSIVSIFANILVLPLIPIAMLFGAALIPLAVVSNSVAMVFAPIAQLPLSTIIFLTSSLAVPFATVQLIEIPWQFMVLVTFVLTLVGIWIGFKKKES